jgi:hypothetical protein
MREVTAIEPKWLPEIAPQFYESKVAAVPSVAEASTAAPQIAQTAPGILHYSPF